MNIQTVAADLTAARDFSETGLTSNVTPIPISQIQPEITDPYRRFPAWRLGVLTAPRLAPHNYPFLASIAIGIIATVIGLELRMVDNGLLPAAGEVLLVTRDSLVTTRLRAACVSRGLRVLESEAELSSPPRLVAVDLADPAALRSVPEWRHAWPDALLAGHIALPDRVAWLAAEQAGFDLVVNQGAFVSAVLRRLDSPPVPARRRYPLIAASDAAGRLGCVLQLSDSPVGPLALYHIGKQFYAIADRCPHAGARLSQGELVGSVLTCPEHGSQFDLQTGDRLRGPADESPRRFPLVEEGGQVYLLGDAQGLPGGER